MSLCLYGHVVSSVFPLQGAWQITTFFLHSGENSFWLVFSVGNVGLCCGLQLLLDPKGWSIMTSKPLGGAVEYTVGSIMNDRGVPNTLPKESDKGKTALVLGREL